MRKGSGKWAQIFSKSFSKFCAGLPAPSQQSKPMQKSNKQRHECQQCQTTSWMSANKQRHEGQPTRSRARVAAAYFLIQWSSFHRSDTERHGRLCECARVAAYFLMSWSSFHRSDKHSSQLHALFSLASLSFWTDAHLRPLYEAWCYACLQTDWYLKRRRNISFKNKQCMKRTQQMLHRTMHYVHCRTFLFRGIRRRRITNISCILIPTSSAIPNKV